jgi:hypothetical protein
MQYNRASHGNGTSVLHVGAGATVESVFYNGGMEHKMVE